LGQVTKHATNRTRQGFVTRGKGAPKRSPPGKRKKKIKNDKNSGTVIRGTGKFGRSCRMAGSWKETRERWKENKWRGKLCGGCAIKIKKPTIMRLRFGKKANKRTAFKRGTDPLITYEKHPLSDGGEPRQRWAEKDMFGPNSPKRKTET